MSVEKSIIRSSVIVTVFTVSAAALGFLSQVVIAYLFGASAELDAYLTAGALPLTFSGLVLGGIGYTLIPILSNTHEKEVPRSVTSCFLATLGVASSMAVAGAFVSQYTLRWTAPGLSAQKLELCAHLQVFFWLAAGFTVVASFFVGVSHFYKKFPVPAASTLITPVCTILSGLLWGRKLGVYSIAGGFLLGSMIQCVLVFLAINAGRQLWSRGLSSVARQYLGTSVPVIISLLPYTLIPAIDAFWCARLPDGSLSYLGYATRISIGLAGVTVQGISAVIFPFLAQHSAVGEMDALRSRVVGALKFVLFLMIPMATLLFVVRAPVIALLFQRGRFNEQSTLGLSNVLPWYLVGMVSMAGMNIVSRGFYAVRDLRTPVLMAVCSLFCYFTLSGLLSRKYSYIGIGVTYALYWSLQLAAATHLLGRRTGSLWQTPETKILLKVVAFCFAVGVVLHFLSVYLPSDIQGLYRIVSLTLTGSVLLAILGRFALGSGELQPFSEALSRGKRS